jgi:hypothetical protein
VLTVGVISSLLPLAAQAQLYGQPSQSQTSTYQSQQTYQSSQTTSTSALSGSAQVTQVNTSGEVVVGPDASSSILPEMTVGLGTTTINVLNPSPRDVVFSVPSLNISYNIPANSERMVQIDRSQTASLTPGQQVAYYINDSSGNQIASSTLVNNQDIASQIDTSTQVAASETTTTTESTTTATTEEQQPTTRRSTVRGFW